MYKKVLLSKHIHKCEQNPDGEQNLKWGECSRLSELGELMMPVGKEKISALNQNVLARMRDDSVSKIVEGDPLIILFGERMSHVRKKGRRRTHQRYEYHVPKKWPVDHDLALRVPLLG